ncbi:hypothetical protein BO86DRAFT_416648 [Aspergillus japonicus CBS 114.51]|uniref:Uncharacterized protein n=1 Tax=Aspergillus japonicus CBS 114.51 TaxID=1448312 RepID=A0A8T8X9R7_ASPJA|nr:hypothetical protein BO86DRAFT_416648 [Aspergillus japonicus CBS 114.51]RAH84614.1 hypothetical protein BO86DRAFT_416648 [Aspergillus japonicus CBS 114.51]
MQGETPAQTVSSLGQALRAVGGLTKPSGRGLFMFQCLLAGSSTAAIIGLFGATVLGYACTAGAVGFLGGSCLGFLLGSIGYYRTCCHQSLIAFVKYPELMRHHIDMDFGMHGVAKASRFRGATLQGMLVAAWHSAVPAIEDIQNQEEARLVANQDEGQTGKT